MTDELDFPVPKEPGVLLQVATVSAATGALVGGIEGLGLVLGTKIVLGAGGAAALVLATVALDAAVGFGVGLAGGLVAAVLGKRVTRWKRLRIGTTLAVLLLALFFLGPLARDLWFVQERRSPAIGMIALATVVSATWWFNAGYWFRRDSIGAGPVVGWRVYAPLVGALFAVVAALTGGRPDGPPSAPPQGVPNLVLVTIDTLRRDHLGAYGSVANTPVFDTLAREGALFEDAVTPVPETAPSHVSMFTGLHPGVHKVVANGIPLKGGYLTVTEQLEVTGYRTGAFVSSFAAGSATGLGQGFQVFDDDFSPAVRGLSQGRVARLALPLLLRFGDPADWPWLLERPAYDTIDHALDWAGSGTEPMFLWVHLFEPHSPYERHDCAVPPCESPVDHRAILAQEPGYTYTPDEEAKLRALYRHEVEYTDTQLGALLDGLRARGLLDDALVAVVADHGESLGEHGIKFNHHGLYDDVLRVPLVLWSKSRTWGGARVKRQVNVADLANTLLDFAGVPLLSKTESVPLLTHVRGVDVPARPLLLLGRMEASLKAGQLYGVRDPTGVKYIARSDGEEVYDLLTDPGELVDIGPTQPGVLANGRANVAALKTALGGGTPTTSVSVDERLKSLGYME